MKMIAPQEIDRIARKVAEANLTAQAVERVFSEPTSDSDGEDAIQLVIVVRAGEEEGIRGDAAIKTLVGIQDSLQEAGEERFAFVKYATEADLADAGN